MLFILLKFRVDKTKKRYYNYGITKLIPKKEVDKISIKKLFNKHDKKEKIVTKSIRLKEEADKALQILARESDRSQNETLNIILEDAYQEYSFFENIEKEWKDKPTDKLELRKIIKFGEIRSYIECSYMLKPLKKGLECHFSVVFREHREGVKILGAENIFSGIFIIEKIVDLINAGIDSSCSYTFESDWSTGDYDD